MKPMLISLQSLVCKVYKVHIETVLSQLPDDQWKPLCFQKTQRNKCKLGNIPRDSVRCGVCIAAESSRSGNQTNTLIFITGRGSCRKANIGLGGLGGAVRIRKPCGCEGALFSVLSPRRLNLKPESLTVEPGGTSWLSHYDAERRPGCNIPQLQMRMRDMQWNPFY